MEQGSQMEKLWFIGFQAESYQQSTLYLQALKSLALDVRTGQIIPKPLMGDKPFGHPFSLSLALLAPGPMFLT